MSRGRRYSAIIRQAANESLWDGKGSYYAARDAKSAKGGSLEKMSCLAVDTVEKVGDIVFTWLFQEMGAYDGFRDTDFEPGEELQSVRYAWLMFAASIADEWNLRK